MNLDKCIPVALSLPQSRYKTVSSLQAIPLCPLKPVLVPSPSTCNHRSVFWTLFPKMPWQGNHTVSNLWNLTHCNWHNAFEIHPSCCIYQESVPLYYWVVRMYYSLFIHSPEKGHLGVPVLATMNKAIINIFLHVFVCISFCFSSTNT